MKLIATYPILFRSTQYRVGQTLPADDESMVKAWLDAGTAAWEEETAKAVKAKPAAAESGLAGDSANSETAENLVGKVPKTAARKKK